MDGNGRADIIWHNVESGAVSVWLMDGPTISAFRALGGVPLDWQIVGDGGCKCEWSGRRRLAP